MSANGASAHLCFILLAENKLPEKSALAAALEAYPATRDVTVEPLGQRDALLLKSAHGTATVMLMPAPVPNREADEAAKNSLAGLAGWAPEPHVAHLLVTDLGSDNTAAAKPGFFGRLFKPRAPDTLGRLENFTQLAAALARATKAVGVYWGHGNVTHHPEYFDELARSERPVPLWVGASVVSKSGGVEVLSMGMEQMGLPDLLLHAPDASMESTGFLYDMLSYTVQLGRPFKEGETIGRTAEEKLRVRYLPSPVDSSKTVWSVVLPRKK